MKKFMFYTPQTFKDEIEKQDQYNGALLAPQDIKIIFGNIPPIYSAHVKLRDSLSQLVDNWSEDSSVGKCIIDRVSCKLYYFAAFSCVWLKK